MTMSPDIIVIGMVLFIAALSFIIYSIYVQVVISRLRARYEAMEAKTYETGYEDGKRDANKETIIGFANLKRNTLRTNDKLSQALETMAGWSDKSHPSDELIVAEALSRDEELVRKFGLQKYLTGPKEGSSDGPEKQESS